MNTMTRFLLSFALVLAIASPSFAQSIPVSSETKSVAVTPNAAVGYLMALGFLEPASKEVMDELADVKTIAALDKLSDETKRYLSGGKIPVTVNLLKMGAGCEFSRFGYERTFRPDEPVPPFRRLRELGRTMRAYGLNLLKDGRQEDAAELFRSLYRLGGHLEVDGTLISGMIGIALRGFAIDGFQELLARNPSEPLKASLREFLKLQPSSIEGMRACLEFEKRFMITALGMITNGLDNETDEKISQVWESIKIIIPEGILSGKPIENPSPQPFSPLRECLANQRVLRGAVEMLGMDYSPMPASLTVDLIPGFLVKQQYLKAFPVCREGGKYQLIKVKEGIYDWKCTVHPTPEAAGSVSDSVASASTVRVPPEDIKRFREFVLGPDFQKMRQETIDLYDEAKTLDPKAADFLEKAEAFKKKVENSNNPVARNAIPNVRKAFENAFEKDQAVQKIIEGKRQ